MENYITFGQGKKVHKLDTIIRANNISIFPEEIMGYLTRCGRKVSAGEMNVRTYDDEPLSWVRCKVCFN